MNAENKPKVGNWIKNSVTLKVVTITILMLLLLIPSAMIKSIITERESLKETAVKEVSSKWAESQRINGPVLTIPILYRVAGEDGPKTAIKNWHILPETLNIEGEVNPNTLRRGIYEVVVYKSLLNVVGNFDLSQTPNPTNLVNILYDQAFLTIGVSDLRGIKNDIEVEWAGQPLKVKPGSRISGIIYSGVTIELPDLKMHVEETGNVPFSFDLNLQGSQNLSFVPVGGRTDISLTSGWASPSFMGNFLPDDRSVSDSGFSAQWSVLELNRNLPQSWMSGLHSDKFDQVAFGVDLILPLDNYQKAMRSAKYAIMTIALTFLIFFLVEILGEKKIHPLQYAMVGLALCLFYVLLVSITEHSNFNLAYGLSTAGIVMMVVLYSLSVFKKGKLSLLLIAALCGIYGFVFVTLQLSDYALLMGSVGLTLILGVTMYATRKINWYQLKTTAQ